MKKVFKNLKRSHLLILYLLGAIFIIASKRIEDYDIWYHLRTGEYIIKYWSIPHKDLFSHTAQGHPWITHEWLSQVIFHLFYHNLGLLSLIFLKASIITLTFYLLFKMLYKFNQNLTQSVTLTFLAALVSVGSFSERPQLFSYLFFVLLLYLLSLHPVRNTNLATRYNTISNGVYKENKNYLLVLPFLTALWANCHASFFLVFVVLLVFIFAEYIKSYLKAGATLLPDKELVQQAGRLGPLIVILFLTILFSLINPNTYKLFLYPFGTIFNPMHTKYILEWQSPNFHLLQTKFFEFMLLLTIVCFALSKEIDLTDLLLFLIFTHFALDSVRHLPLFALVATPILGKHIGNLFSLFSEILEKFTARSLLIFNLRQKIKRVDKGVSPNIPLLNWLILLFLIVFLSYNLPHSNKFTSCVKKSEFPLGAAEFIKENNLKGNMFNEYDWGGFLIFKLYPDYRVFIDGRMDIYADKVFLDYLKIERLETGWEKICRKYKIKFFLLKRDSPFAQALRERGDFKVIYQDKLSVIICNRQCNRQF